MVNNFDQAFTGVIGVEGGYSNDPNDPGGETKYGISKRAYPDENIPNMTLERAKMLYKRDYWDAAKCDLTPYPLDVLVFDAAVNQGVEPAIKMLQKVLNVAQDGVFGADTQRKVKDAGKECCALYMAERALRYTGTRNFDRFGRGWFKRLFIVVMDVV